MMLCFRLFYRWLLLTWSRISRRISRVRCDLLHQQHSLLCFWFIFCKRMQRDWFKVKCLQRNLKEHSQVRAAFSRLVYLHQDCIDLGTTQFYISERFPSSKNSLVALVLQANRPFGVSVVVVFFLWSDKAEGSVKANLQQLKARHWTHTRPLDWIHHYLE